MSGTQKLDAKGGAGGDKWDDESDYGGVTKITGGYSVGIDYVKFDYVKGGQPKQGALHGAEDRRTQKKEVTVGFSDAIDYVKFDYVKSGQPKQGILHGGQARRTQTKEIPINHLDEYLIAVEGWYDDTNVILGIRFITNKQPNPETIGYDYTEGSDTKFTLQVQDKKIIGFHGFSTNKLNSIGAYFTTTGSGKDTESESSVPEDSGSGVQKLNAKGGEGGTEWNDGSDYDGVTKIYVGHNQGIDYVQFDYSKGKQGAIHGAKGRRAQTKEIPVNHPNEYLISVEGWYDDSNVIQGFRFITNKQSNPETIGEEYVEKYDTKFTLQVKEKKIIGFHGSASNKLNSIGAYFAPTTGKVPAKKLEAKGGESGAEWDDKAHENVKKVYVGQGHDGVASVKFEYTNGSEVVIGDAHGKPTRLGFEDFTLESDEYITIVRGTTDNTNASGGVVVTRLEFETNKNNIYVPYGVEGSGTFEFKEEGHKITGFHGRVGENYFTAIGVYIAPLGTIPLTPAKPAN